MTFPIDESNFARPKSVKTGKTSAASLNTQAFNDSMSTLHANISAGHSGAAEDFGDVMDNENNSTGVLYQASRLREFHMGKAHAHLEASFNNLADSKSSVTSPGESFTIPDSRTAGPTGN